MSKRLEQLMAAKDKATQKKHSAEQEEKRYAQQISKESEIKNFRNSRCQVSLKVIPLPCE